MLKIISIVDKENTAIDRLAKGIIPYFDNLDYKVLDCHPKKASLQQLQAIERECKDADIIDMQYFRTSEMLRERFPWLKEKKTILTHYNPYSFTEKDWNDYDMVVACNQYIYDKLGEITSSPLEYIPLTVDTDFWKYQTEFTPNDNVIMVANRIESKKGVLEVAQACKILNLNLQLVGAISDAEYFNKIIDTGVVRFHEQISDEQLRDLYYKSTVHVCNSVDGFESGTLPLLEAMLTGVPVITRKVGHVEELNNGENMVINGKENTDVEHLSNLIHDLMSDKKKLLEMRDKAWQTAKNRGNSRRAFMIQKLYRQVLHPNTTPVSIVVPVYDKPDIIRKCLDAISKQTYTDIELIVCDDSINGKNESLILDFAKYVNFPVRYIKTAQIIIDAEHPRGVKSYGLARARNRGTEVATGEIIVFCDQRMIMQPDCVEEFVKHSKPRYWLYGNKGVERPFLENASCLYKEDIVRFGGFPEAATEYGFLSQYCRSVSTKQDLKKEYCPSAKFTPTGKSSNRNRKRQEIINSKNRLWMLGLE